MVHPTNNKSLSQKIFWHLNVVAGAIIISLVFDLILQQKIFSQQFPSMFIMTLVQLEIFIWLGTWFFQSIKSDDPKFLSKMLVRLLLFYLSVLGIAVTAFVIIYLYQFIKNGSDFSIFFSSLFNLEMKSFLIATMIGFSLGALFFFYTQWAEAIKNMQKLREEKLIFQYETLKNQVNPHFLFNSLNTLSSLVRENPDLSEEFIQKLSHIYRYILDDKSAEMVPLSEELKFVQDYFYLQKIRDEEKIELKIEINNLERAGILPVSLQLLVENALKHNSATRSNPLVITIHNEGLEKLVVRNNLQKKTRLNESSGIGLKNLNERCRLIINREIEIQETSEEYIVRIPVKSLKS